MKRWAHPQPNKRAARLKKRMETDPLCTEQIGTKQVVINGQTVTVKVYKAAADANLKERGLA